MASIGTYKLFVAALLLLLSVSSATGVYLYQLRSGEASASVARSANLNNQISSLNNQIGSLKSQIRDVENWNNSDGQQSLKARVALLEREVLKLQATIDQLNATTSLQANEIATLKSQVQDLQALLQQKMPIILNGAGATFPYPFLSAVSANYSRTHPNVNINYDAIGSGVGITNFASKAVDFAASDAPLSDAQRASAPDSLHIPETIGAVTVAYNLPSPVVSGMNLTASAIAQIFQGNITMWNDNRIVRLNPGIASFPNQPIKIVHRADAAGTTFVFSKYLSSFSQGAWVLGASNGIAWPIDSIGTSGNQGVAGVVQGTLYSIGYVELNYALQNNMKIASVRTTASSGNFVLPTIQNVAFAVGNATEAQAIPSGDQSWTNVRLLNATGTSSYPIVSFTYLLVYKELNDTIGMTHDKAKTLVDFLWFIVHGGQDLAAPNYYVSLAHLIVTINEATIHSMTFNGQILKPPNQSIRVIVAGQQFSWSFNCSDPCSSPSLGVLVVPRDTMIILTVTSSDVFHALGILELGVKVDAIPGRSNTISFSAPSGTYKILCIELCGLGHSTMRGTLTVV